MTKRNCLNCKKSIIGKNKRNNKYCNSFCFAEHRYKQYIKRRLGNKETGLSGDYQISRYIKRWLREIRGTKCERCGWNAVHPTTKKVPVEVNHKDGNYRNCRPKNLELICPNCHSLTLNFRGLNRGNGREQRRIKGEPRI